jgi:hypothetical protein
MLSRLDELSGFVLIGGNARSGSTLLGAILDAHPEIVIANETETSSRFWLNTEKQKYFAEVLSNAESNAISDRISAGYRYQIGEPPSRKSRIRFLGDKIWNPSTLLLHGDLNLIPNLERLFACPIFFINAVRNPYDVISTMCNRSGAPLDDRISWFFSHCESLTALENRLPKERFLNCYNEDLITNPNRILPQLFSFLNIPTKQDLYLKIIDQLFKKPRITRNGLKWTDEQIRTVQERIKTYPFLHPYYLACPLSES